MFVVFTRIDRQPGRDGIGCVLVEKGTPGFSVTGTLPHDGRREPARDPLRGLRAAAGEPGRCARTASRKLLSAFNTQRCLNPSISLGLAEGAFEEAVTLRQRAHGLRPRDRRFPGHALEARRDVQATSRPAAASSTAPAPAPTRSPIRYLAAVAKVYLQRDGAARHQRGDPGAWRLRLH